MFLLCSLFLRMGVETIGEAYSYGWRVTARCAHGKQDGMHRHKECVYRAELDMETLVWTRGRGGSTVPLGEPTALSVVRIAGCALDLHGA
jgi:hypothetical protein